MELRRHSKNPQIRSGAALAKVATITARLPSLSSSRARNLATSGLPIGTSIRPKIASRQISTTRISPRSSSMMGPTGSASRIRRESAAPALSGGSMARSQNSVDESATFVYRCRVGTQSTLEFLGKISGGALFRVESTRTLREDRGSGGQDRRGPASMRFRRIAGSWPIGQSRSTLVAARARAAFETPTVDDLDRRPGDLGSPPTTKARSHLATRSASPGIPPLSRSGGEGDHRSGQGRSADRRDGMWDSQALAKFRYGLDWGLAGTTVHRRYD